VLPAQSPQQSSHHLAGWACQSLTLPAAASRQTGLTLCAFMEHDSNIKPGCCHCM
jgi:hypothetical protein